MVGFGSGIKPKSDLKQLKKSREDIEFEIRQIRREYQMYVSALQRLGKDASQQGFASVEDEFFRVLTRLETLEKRLNFQITTKKSIELNAFDHLKNLAAGGVATSMSRTVIAPIDRVKIQLQTNPDINGSVEAARAIYASHGIPGFFRGNAVNVARVFLKGGLQFAVYDDFKIRLKFLVGSDTYSSKMFCAVSGVSFVTTCLHPVDLVRLRLMKDKDLTLPRFLKDTYKNHGFRGFYNGYVSSLIAIGPFQAINFATYDYLKSQFDNPPALLTLSLGGFAGMIAGCMCYPTDTISKIVMSAKKDEGITITGTVNNIIATKGYRGFYRGFSMSMLKIMPQNGVRFLVYENLRRLFHVGKHKD